MVVACLILNYNDSETTIKLLNNIKSYKSIDNIVIVDNCSTDDSVKNLKPFETKRIHVITSEKNGGYGYGNNYGIRYSVATFKATHILIANPDVFFTEDVVDALKSEFLKSDDCAIIAPVQKKNNRIVAWRLETTAKIVLTASLVITKLFKDELTKYRYDYFRDKETCYVDIVSGSLLMVNAEIMMKFGMYDEEMFLYFEEIVLAHKLMISGYKSKIMLNTIYEHEHSTSIRKNIKSIVTTKKLLLDNEIIFFTKYRGIKGVKLRLIKLFFGLVLFETWLYSLFKKIKSFIE